MTSSKKATSSLKKDYKRLTHLLTIPKRERMTVGPEFLAVISTLIHSFAPTLSIKQPKVIRDCDRCFCISSSRSGSIVISDYELAYNIIPDPKNVKYLRAQLVSNHPVCRLDAAHVSVDHRDYIFFRELTGFNNENLMMFIPNKAAPKRLDSFKIQGDDRCVYCDGFVHVSKDPKSSVVFVKNGESSITKYRIPNKNFSKYKREVWTRFDGELPNAESMVVNSRHDCIFFLQKDYELLSLDLYAILLPKNKKKVSNIIPIKSWNINAFRQMGLISSDTSGSRSVTPKKYFPSATNMCYLRSVGGRNGCLAISIEKHLFFICEDPRKGHRFEFYDYYVGRANARLYDIAEDPDCERSLLSVDGIVQNPKLYYYDIL